MKQILVVEDDNLLNSALCYNLESDGYKAISASNVRGAREFIKKESFDLIVLDVNLPDGNGFDLCKQIKDNYDIPVIFLTANDMESDAIKGFELGADDYVTKPFSINIFQKKIAALLKRTEKQETKDNYIDGHLMIDFSQMAATIDEKQLLLTPLEYRMLKILVSNAKIVLTRRVLLEKLWDVDGNFVDEHTLTSNISRLRNKIESDDYKYIKTVYSMGYMWVGERG